MKTKKLLDDLAAILPASWQGRIASARRELDESDELFRANVVEIDMMEHAVGRLAAMIHERPGFETSDTS